MKKSILIIILLTSIFSLALAQSEDLREDIVYFQKQSKLYQTWLEREGIGQHLGVKEIDVKKDQFALFLEFKYQDLDSIINAWEQIKGTFEDKSNLSLEQQLFYKLTLMMELRQSVANILIYDTYDLKEEPLFYRWIKFDSDSGRVIVKSSAPKSEKRYINIPLKPAMGSHSGARLSIDHEGSKKVLFEKIVKYAEKEIIGKECRERYPELKILEDEEVLRFRVQDLCREVLVEESQSLLCQVARRCGFKCNDITREMLVFTITYQPSVNGARLEIDIDGLFGSGFYSKVERGAYKSMDLDPRFKPYLVEYADDIKRQLKKSLK